MNSSLGLTVTLLSAILHGATNSHLGLKKGSVCDGGTCTALSECTTIGDLKTIRPDICSFQGMLPIICCPSTTPSRPQIVTTTKIPTIPQSSLLSTFSKINNFGAKADRKCSEYNEKACEGHHSAGNFHRTIVGGTKSKPRDLNFMALLGNKYGNEAEWSCGGSLISNYWVLSAAHCGILNLKWIRLGELDLDSKTDDANPTDYPIQLSKIHPGYKKYVTYNDIALFKSQYEIKFNNYIRPICLDIYPPNIYNKAWVAGWGMTEFGGERSSYLLQAELNFMRSTDCRARLKNGRSYPSGINSTSQICTAAVDKADNRSACQGDSGGPLFQYGSRCLKYQIGVIVSGKGCEHGTGVNTWILPYINWIEEIVWPDEEN